jgi:predicted P-loop ATPase
MVFDMTTFQNVAAECNDPEEERFNAQMTEENWETLKRLINDALGRSKIAAQGAANFLEKLRPGGPWVLTAIEPDGATDTITARNAAEVRRFVLNNNGRKNLYFSVNPTRTKLTSKASKLDIAVIEFSFVDLDPRPEETAEAAKARYLAGLETFKPAPTVIIDSGNGVQALWRLSSPIILPEPAATENPQPGQPRKVYSDETLAVINDAEGRAKALMETLNSVSGTQNVDRILRLPGTINLPNAKKLKEGRTARPTKLLKFDDVACTLDEFPSRATRPEGAVDDARPSKIAETSNIVSFSKDIDWLKVEEHTGWLKGVDDLPDNFNFKGKMIVAHAGNIKDLNLDIQEAGHVTKPYQSWSEVGHALAAIFKNHGGFTNEQIAAALMCDLPCNQHVNKMAKEGERRRAVERSLIRSHTPEPGKTRHVVGEPDWRERRENGRPLPSMHNARLAIAALGITCSHDTFHNSILFGYRDDKVKHELASIVGEVSDNGIIALRQLMSDKLHFDPKSETTRDAVISLAMENRFDPVVDLIDKAEREWDCVKRLDRMAAEYFNTEDTPLNSVCIRKVMIALVKRAREPGCKFDTIPVLESKEGFNKSSAWLTLAGAENFSDQAIIGKDAKEVQEGLGSVWIHESADLAGMRKADIEAVKAFASRTTDIARAAYGRFVTKQPRHSIEVGTTNDIEYLQSQTGNRRFWPMKVLKSIDIEKLAADRLQLIGEAATYQSASESLVLDEELWAVAGIEQEKRRTKDLWEDALDNLPDTIDFKEWKDGQHRDETIQLIHHAGEQEIVAASDLLEYVLRIPIAQQTTAIGRRLSNAMKQIGWERHDNGYVYIEGKRQKGYFRWQPGAGSRDLVEATMASPEETRRIIATVLGMIPQEEVARLIKAGITRF